MIFCNPIPATAIPGCTTPFLRIALLPQRLYQAESLLRPTTPGSPVSQNAKSDVIEIFLHHAVESPELYINTA